MPAGTFPAIPALPLARMSTGGCNRRGLLLVYNQGLMEAKIASDLSLKKIPPCRRDRYADDWKLLYCAMKAKTYRSVGFSTIAKTWCNDMNRYQISGTEQTGFNVLKVTLMMSFKCYLALRNDEQLRVRDELPSPPFYLWRSGRCQEKISPISPTKSPRCQ